MSTEIVTTEQAIVAQFDYESLDDQVRQALREQEDELDLVLTRTRKEIGGILLKIKDILPHGQFMAWVDAKGLKYKTAYDYMREAKGTTLKSLKFRVLPQIE